MDDAPSSSGQTSTDDLRGDRLSRVALVFIFLVAVVLRVGYGAYRSRAALDPLALEFPDEVDYWTMARNLDAGCGLLDPMGFRAARMPLYPAFLSLFAGFEVGIQYAKLAQRLVGSLAAVAVAALGARIRGRRVGLMAGLLVACDPFLVFFSSSLLTETLFTTAMATLWAMGWRIATRAGRSANNAPSHRVDATRSEPAFWNWCTFAVLGAVCVYLRESSAPLVVAWALFVALITRRETIAAARVRSAASQPPLPRWSDSVWLGPVIVVAILILALLPWGLRNQRVLGEFHWLTTRGGVSLYDGVGPQATGKGRLEDVYRRAELQGLNEADWNRWFERAAWQAIRSDPGRIARLAVTKVIRTWSPIPNADEYKSRLVRLVSAGWTIPTWALAVVGIVSLRRRPATVIALLLPALYFTGMHALFVGSVRYRLPATAIVAVLTAVGADSVWRRMGDRARRRPGLARPSPARVPDRGLEAAPTAVGTTEEPFHGTQ